MFRIKPVTQYSSTTHNIVFDGNSHIFGVGLTGSNTPQYLAKKVHALPLLASSGLTVKSFGISGQSWTDMKNNIADVNNAFEAGKENVLIVLETANQISDGPKTKEGLLTKIQEYTASVNSGYRIILITAPASGFKPASENVTMDEVNKAVIATPKQYGFDAVVNTRRTTSPFYFEAYTQTDFERVTQYIVDAEHYGSGTATQGWMAHHNKAGQDIWARMVEQVLLHF